MKKKKKIQYSGKLKSYMQWPVIMVLFFLIMNVAVYFLDVKAGLVVSVFFVLYAVMVLVMRFHYRPSIMNEMISFATQYGQIQKTLLNEAAIVFLSDKLIQETERVTIEKRFAESLCKCNSPEALKSHERQLKQALDLQNMIQTICHMTI